MKTLRTKSGFTLIELLIYVGITAIVVVSLTQVMITILETRQNTGRISEVQQNMRFVMDRMITILVDTVEIQEENSVFNSSEGVLALTIGSGSIAQNPSIFSMTESGVYLLEGEGEPIRITLPEVIIEKMQFTLLSNGGSWPILKIQLDGKDNRKPPEKPESVSLHTSFVLRQ